MYDMNFVPLFIGHPTTNLGGAVVTNGNDEERISKLRRQTERLRTIEFVWPVDCKAIRRSAQTSSQPSNGGGVRSEMYMHVVDS